MYQNKVIHHWPRIIIVSCLWDAALFVVSVNLKSIKGSVDFYIWQLLLSMDELLADFVTGLQNNLRKSQR